MKKIMGIIMLFGMLFLVTNSLEARKKHASITTSLGDLLMLIDLSHTTNSASKVYIDNEDCQCVCMDSQWSCVNTDDCHLQEEVCLDDQLSYDDDLPHKFTT